MSRGGLSTAVVAALLVGLGTALGLAVSGAAPAIVTLAIVAALCGLIFLDLMLLPEWRLPAVLLTLTILGLALALARSESLAKLFELGRFAPPLVLFLVVIRSGVWRRLDTPAATASWPLLALVTLAFLSVVYSLDPATTLVKAVALAIVLLGIAAAVRWADYRRTSLAPSIACAFAIVVVTNLAALLLGVGEFSPVRYPGRSLTGERYMGWMSNPNTLGILCGLTIAVLVGLVVTRPRLRTIGAVGIGCSGLLLLLTGSRGGLLAAALGSLAVMRTRRITTSMSAPVVFLGFVLIAPIAFQAASQTNLRIAVDRPGQTGREEVWPVAWREISERPLLGAGFDTTEGRFEAGEFGRFDVFQGAHFHNSYLEAAVELGAPAGVILVVVGGYAMTFLVRRVPLEYAWAAGLAVSCATAGIFETGLLTPGALLFVPFWLSLGILVVVRSREAAGTASAAADQGAHLARA